MLHEPDTEITPTCKEVVLVRERYTQHPSCFQATHCQSRGCHQLLLNVSTKSLPIG